MKEKTLGEVYLVTCLVTGKQYVGITTKGYLKRWQKHVSVSRRHRDDYKFHAAIRKHGAENFKIEVLESKTYVNKNRLVRWLCKREMFWIEKLNTKHNGYNATEGGDGVTGLTMDEERKRAISERMKQFYIDNPEMKEKVVSKAHAKLRDPEYRKVASQRTKEFFTNPANCARHAEATKNGMECLPPKTKAKIKQTQFKKGRETWNKGKETPIEVRQKISASEKGRVAWNKGVPMPEEQKRKVSESKKGTPAWNKGKKVERKEMCPVCGKLICWNMLNKHLRARHETY